MGKWSKRVYACPLCWTVWSIGVRPQKWFKCKVPGCRVTLKSHGVIVFDSLAEHRVELELRELQMSGIISDLKYHEKFDLLPELFLSEYISSSVIVDSELKQKRLFVTTENSKKYPALFKTHNTTVYESDFTFTQGGVKKVIEVKRLEIKTVTRIIQDADTGEKFKQKVKISWPKFIEPESRFRLKCRLMKLIHGLEVEVWAGGRKYRYNEKWKLMEVIK